MHLRHPTVLADHLLKTKKITKFKRTWDLRYIYQSEPDKACSQYDMAYEDFKDFPMRTASVSVLRVKHLILLKIQSMMDINVQLLQWLINF